ncbi:hypothetical protein [Phaeobacter sp. 22II1-1F12B]|uniref:hypothetical protein n=1 Tax=Phaeobacter sp. 22II1-1F12B TaxID=1317111 RepID=UPI001186EA72|nr:hypothetical protein [Phaeobacter sp. 22II1-1F12B]
MTKPHDMPSGLVSDGSRGRMIPSSLRLSEEGAAYVIAGFGTLIAVVNIWRNHLFLHDDAFISLRYAKHFVEHGDLSWNLGDRVEGYTNFLYVIMTSFMLEMGVTPILAIQLINVLSAIALVAAVVFTARRIMPEEPHLQALAYAAVVCNVSLSVWVFGGLEAPVVAAFLAWGMALSVCYFQRQNRPQTNGLAALTGVFFAAAALVRPDAVIVIAAFSLALFFFGAGMASKRFARMIVAGGIPLLAVLVHMIWRVDYYGDFLPNTFHAKVGLELGHRLQKVTDYLLEAGALYLPVLSLAGLAFIVAAFHRQTSRLASGLVFTILGFLLYVTWSGGDHMAASRVILPIVGFAAVLLAVSIRALPERLQTYAVIGSLCLFALSAINARSFKMDWAAFNGAIVGKYIATAWPAGSLVGLNTAGSTPFYAENHVYIDMLGLNDRTIAKREDVPVLARRQRMPGHAKGDGAYVLSRKPDYIIFGGSEGIDIVDAEKWFLTGVELRGDPEFQTCYEKATQQLPVPEDMRRSGRPGDPIVFTYYRRTCPT